MLRKEASCPPDLLPAQVLVLSLRLPVRVDIDVLEWMGVEWVAFETVHVWLLQIQLNIEEQRQKRHGPDQVSFTVANALIRSPRSAMALAFASIVSYLGSFQMEPSGPRVRNNSRNQFGSR